VEARPQELFKETKERDIWALGLTTYILAAGQQPFAAQEGEGNYFTNFILAAW
jgi:hypothetical protein